jgi:hypothetical protein
MVHARVGGRGFVETQLTRGRLSDGTEIAYALGALYVTEWRGIPEISHSGGTAGYRAWLARYPLQGLSVAVLCNAGDASAWILGRQVADLALGLKPAAAPAAAPLESGPLDAMAGLYRNRRTHEALAIELADKQLRVPGMGALVPVSTDVLRAESAGVEVTLLRDGRGAVSGFRAVVSDEVREFERVERARPSAADLEALAGTYASDEAEVTLTVAMDRDRLVLRRRPNATFPLTPTYADGFGSQIGHLRFLRDKTGKVTGLSLGRDRLWDLRFARVTQDAVKRRNRP